MRRVLLIAFQFPPMSGTSGIQRTLRFAQHLPRFGWEPMVLTAAPRAYPSVSDDQLADIPPHMPINRAFALDTAKHLALGGRYPKLLAVPDRWISWCIGAIPAGIAMARRYEPQAIWSTYPIASAHVVAMAVSRLTGIPWVADFRDSMTEAGYPRDPMIRRWFERIERATVQRCAKAVFTTPGAVRMYRGRYSTLPAERFSVIENGYDEGSFAGIDPSDRASASKQRKLTLVHSGVIYPAERDPTQLFDALAALRDAGRISSEVIQIVLRAPGHEGFLQGLIDVRRLGAIVQIAPAIPYRDALAEMVSSDGLLLLQGADCNHQIPAKVYEYLRAGRPILGLTDAAGDTAGVLREAGIDTIAPLESRAAIAAQLERFVALLRAGTAPLPDPGCVGSHSRERGAMQLAEMLESLVEPRRERWRVAACDDRKMVR